MLTHCLSLALLLFVSTTLASNLIEDITDQHDDSNDPFDDNLQTFPTPPPIGTTTSTVFGGDVLFNRMNEILRKEDGQKSQNFQIFNEKDLVTGSNPYQKSTKKPKNRSSEFQKARDPDPHHQVIAGIPDLSDPCFRRYENSIIVNAQPYERRSSTGLIHCKSHCLNSQTGVYSCRSFVYDNVNMVCDLFAHVGDQAPARLLKFQTRDYYEPTNIVHCLSMVSGSPPSPPEEDQVTETSFLPPPPPPAPEPVAPVVALATNTDKREEDIEDITTSSLEAPEAEENGPKDSCPRGKQSTFLRTEGFELFKNDDQQIITDDVEECARACTLNNVNGRPFNCKSFDFLTSSSTCSFTGEAAVPVGNGQLKQREDAFYNEKICVASTFLNHCPTTFFSRHPQMILVGFAESVSDSPSFEHCFDTCINSYQLFGFNCTSGMYYFEENQLNCILNSENRNTQKELFAEENTDIVDYFEVECVGKAKNQRRMAGVRNFETEAIGADKMKISESLDPEEEENGSRWESWSECQDGKQTRHRSCTNFNKIEDCAEEVRDCPVETSSRKHRKPSIIRAGDSIEDQDDGGEIVEEDPVPTKEEISEVKQRIRREGFKCPLNECCGVFLSCSYGLRHNSHTKQLEWCRRSCDSSATSTKRSRLLR